MRSSSPKRNFGRLQSFGYAATGEAEGDHALRFPVRRRNEVRGEMQHVGMAVELRRDLAARGAGAFEKNPVSLPRPHASIELGRARHQSRQGRGRGREQNDRRGGARRLRQPWIGRIIDRIAYAQKERHAGVLRRRAIPCQPVGHAGDNFHAVALHHKLGVGRAAFERGNRQRRKGNAEKRVVEREQPVRLALKPRRQRAKERLV